MRVIVGTIAMVCLLVACSGEETKKPEEAAVSFADCVNTSRTEANIVLKVENLTDSEKVIEVRFRLSNDYDDDVYKRAFTVAGHGAASENVANPRPGVPVSCTVTKVTVGG